MTLRDMLHAKLTRSLRGHPDEPPVLDLVEELHTKSKALVDSVNHDNNGSMIAGQFVGGNGGLLSHETIAAADALRMELDRWK